MLAMHAKKNTEAAEPQLCYHAKLGKLPFVKQTQKLEPGKAMAQATVKGEAERGEAPLSKGEIIYPPPPPPIFGQEALFRTGRWGFLIFFFRAHAAGILHAPPFLYATPPPLGGYFQGWGGWGGIKVGPV